MAKGDHIRVWRGGYYHHGVDVGRGRVIHFSGEPARKRAASICLERMDRFARGGVVEVVAEAAHGRKGAVVDRARSQLGKQGYDVVVNNCEHFATWCANGRRHSTQVERARAIVDRVSGPSSRAAGAASPRPAKRAPSVRGYAKGFVADGAVAAGVTVVVDVIGGARDVRGIAQRAAVQAVAGASRSAAQHGAEKALLHALTRAGRNELAKQLGREAAHRAVEQAAKQSAGAVFKAAARGNAVSTVAAFGVEQLVHTVQLARGKMSAREYGQATAVNATSSAGGLGGTAAGAALGTLFCPGAGTVIGGIIGGLVGGIGAALGTRRAFRR